MSALADELAAATDRELVDMRRLLHRAGFSRHKLGHRWPSVLAPAWPRLLAAMCIELSDELVRRGEGDHCPTCLADVTRPRVTPPAGPPDPLDPTGLADTFAGRTADAVAPGGS